MIYLSCSDACWAYAVVASVEAAYGIAKQQSAPRLSVEALFALMGLTDSDKCSAGGSPTQAFETLTALDAASGLTRDSDLATTHPMQAFERARFKGYVGLMLAVQRQPVVVHIEASPTFMLYDGTFKYQDPGDPCGQSSYKGDGDSQPSMNPCGRFQCQGTTDTTNICTCNIPTAPVQPFVEVENGYGSNTCAYANTTTTTMTGIDCSQPLPKGSVLQLDGTPATPCTAFFYSLNGDTCAYISRPLKFTELDLTALNPGLDCSKPIKAGSSVCIERSAAFAFTVPECVRYGTLTPQDTCERLLQRTGTSPGGVSAIENQWAALYRNNPGLTCSATIPSSASAVGSNIGVQVRTVRAGGKPSGMGEHGMVGKNLPDSRVLVVHDGDMQEG
ncbi:unnamed protein product [Closterium sp. NIES-64]|nr:unnamed protein product [Closterium sp. NIES-64]